MITSRHNQRLKDIRRLRRSKGELALLEGAHLVEEALAAGLALEEVLVTPVWLETPEGRRLTRHLPLPPLEIEPHLLEELTDADSPRGILAVARLPRSGLEALPAEPEPGAWLYLDGLQDPGNLGALARVAEAAGAAGLALAPGSVHPNHPRALRASAGSLLRLPVAIGAEAGALAEYLEGSRSGRARWMALVPRDGEDLWRAPLASAGTSLVLALGAEGPGLSPPLLARADIRLTISLEPPVESLNATVAAALVLFEIRRRSVS